MVAWTPHCQSLGDCCCETNNQPNRRSRRRSGEGLDGSRRQHKRYQWKPLINDRGVQTAVYLYTLRYCLKQAVLVGAIRALEDPPGRVVICVAVNGSFQSFLARYPTQTMATRRRLVFTRESTMVALSMSLEPVADSTCGSHMPPHASIL